LHPQQVWLPRLLCQQLGRHAHRKSHCSCPGRGPPARLDTKRSQDPPSRRSRNPGGRPNPTTSSIQASRTTRSSARGRKHSRSGSLVLRASLCPFSIEWCGWLNLFESYSTSLAGDNRTIALGVRRRQRTRIRRREPQSHQVPFALGLGPVLKRRPVMQDGVIVYDLNISRLELHEHMKRRIVRQRIEKIERFCLNASQRSDARESASRFDVLTLIQSRKISLVPREHRNAEVGLVPFGYFAPPISFKGCKQRLEEVGPAPAHLVEDRD